MSRALPTYAQTNVQLYNQLLRANWAEDDLRHVQSAYRLALRLVAGYYHASEKPFVSHLVGVASILAHHQAHATVVCAGMLHSVYDHGDFGDGSSGTGESRRRAVRRAVGAASEELVARYSSLQWNVATLEGMVAGAANLSTVDGAVAWIKLADLLETTSDSHGLPAPSRHDAAQLEVGARLAAALGHVALATELAPQAADVPPRSTRLPEFLQANHRGSFAVAPMSHAVRPGVRMARFFRGIRVALLTAPTVARWLT
jgi:(p)ppGpp synthase/HD superfamily hydrolase